MLNFDRTYAFVQYTHNSINANKNWHLSVHLCIVVCTYTHKYIMANLCHFIFWIDTDKPKWKQTYDRSIEKKYHKLKFLNALLLSVNVLKRFQFWYFFPQSIDICLFLFQLIYINSFMEYLMYKHFSLLFSPYFELRKFSDSNANSWQISLNHIKKILVNENGCKWLEFVKFSLK